jgi:hypothetical protein
MLLFQLKVNFISFRYFEMGGASSNQQTKLIDPEMT